MQLKLDASELVYGAYVETQGWFLGGQGCVACSQPVIRSAVLGLMPAGLHPCTTAKSLTHAADSKLQMWVCTAHILEDKNTEQRACVSASPGLYISPDDAERKADFAT